MGRPRGWTLRFHSVDECESTQDEVVSRAALDAAEHDAAVASYGTPIRGRGTRGERSTGGGAGPSLGPANALCTVLVAARQRGGRGREGRAWTQPTGRALCCSVHVAGSLDLGRLSELPAHASSIVIEAVRQALGEHAAAALEARVPNDIYAGERKVGGVLVDTRIVGDELEALTFGVGLNICGEPFEVDGRAATTLEAAGAGDVEEGAEQAIAYRVAMLLMDWFAERR